jgi:hypothetical protein
MQQGQPNKEQIKSLEYIRDLLARTVANSAGSPVDILNMVSKTGQPGSPMVPELGEYAQGDESFQVDTMSSDYIKRLLEKQRLLKDKDGEGVLDLLLGFATPDPLDMVKVAKIAGPMLGSTFAIPKKADLDKFQEMREAGISDDEIYAALQMSDKIWPNQVMPAKEYSTKNVTIGAPIDAHMYNTYDRAKREEDIIGKYILEEIAKDTSKRGIMGEAPYFSARKNIEKTTDPVTGKDIYNLLPYEGEAKDFFAARNRISGTPEGMSRQEFEEIIGDTTYNRLQSFDYNHKGSYYSDADHMDVRWPTVNGFNGYQLDPEDIEKAEITASHELLGHKAMDYAGMPAGGNEGQFAPDWLDSISEFHKTKYPEILKKAVETDFSTNSKTNGPLFSYLSKKDLETLQRGEYSSKSFVEDVNKFKNHLQNYKESGDVLSDEDLVDLYHVLPWKVRQGFQDKYKFEVPYSWSAEKAFEEDPLMRLMLEDLINTVEKSDFKTFSRVKKIDDNLSKTKSKMYEDYRKISGENAARGLTEKGRLKMSQEELGQNPFYKTMDYPIDEQILIEDYLKNKK